MITKFILECEDKNKNYSNVFIFCSNFPIDLKLNENICIEEFNSFFDYVLIYRQGEEDSLNNEERKEILFGIYSKIEHIEYHIGEKECNEEIGEIYKIIHLTEE